MLVGYSEFKTRNFSMPRAQSAQSLFSRDKARSVPGLEIRHF